MGVWEDASGEDADDDAACAYLRDGPIDDGWRLGKGYEPQSFIFITCSCFHRFRGVGGVMEKLKMVSRLTSQVARGCIYTVTALEDACEL